ncbi:MAG: NAD synthetase [uncultured bacterium]|nr:MAG: NAD synthetase [uncultured bacterium]
MNIIINFIKEVFKKAGFSDAVIGLSGGIDSAVSCVLTAQALGVEHVYPILLPYGSLSTQGVLDAMKLVEKLHIPFAHVARIDIKPSVDMIIKSDVMMDRVRRGNIMARVRMTYLFDQAKKHHALVVGTENKTEHIFGYYTRFGDEASDVEPILHVYKTQVYELARELMIPDEIIQKPPSADLWPEQTDEGEFGFTYKDADEILYLLIDEKKTEEEVVASGFEKALVLAVSQRIFANSFKHKTPHIL